MAAAQLIPVFIPALVVLLHSCGGAEPEWPKVFAEEPLANIAALPRKIGKKKRSG